MEYKTAEQRLQENPQMDLQTQTDRLSSLSISVAPNIIHFIGDVGFARGVNVFASKPSALSLNECYGVLAKIEDAIKRFNEGRPQSFEEKPDKE